MESRPGNILIALIKGEAVVKKALRQKGRVILCSTNRGALTPRFPKSPSF